MHAGSQRHAALLPWCTCRDEDACLASLGRQIQPESSVPGVHSSVDEGGDAALVILHAMKNETNNNGIYAVRHVNHAERHG